MHKIGILGDKESVLGFKALGIEVFTADETRRARPILRSMVKDDYAVIYITEHLARDMEEEIEPYRDSVAPAIIVIPGKGGPMGLGMTELKHTVERAVGIDILNMKQ